MRREESSVRSPILVQHQSEQIEEDKKEGWPCMCDAPEVDHHRTNDKHEQKERGGVDS
jgi:hypothetical protein